MCAHPANAAVQEEACGALCNITLGIDAKRNARAQAAVNAGVLRIIVEAMCAHLANAAVQEEACETLCNIAFGIEAGGSGR
mmetsp:Transcript_11122/g.28073  ORF Transcript_11122/g.28073 Transcript_11122/m.28073 type:complete len:81 (-) Transcript_11122:38-280(-)